MIVHIQQKETEHGLDIVATSIVKVVVRLDQSEMTEDSISAATELVKVEFQKALMNARLDFHQHTQTIHEV